MCAYPHWPIFNTEQAGRTWVRGVPTPCLKKCRHPFTLPRPPPAPPTFGLDPPVLVLYRPQLVAPSQRGCGVRRNNSKTCHFTFSLSLFCSGGNFPQKTQLTDPAGEVACRDVQQRSSRWCVRVCRCVCVCVGVCLFV